MAEAHALVVHKSLIAWIIHKNTRLQLVLVITAIFAVFANVFPLEMQRRIINDAIIPPFLAIAKSPGHRAQLHPKAHDENSIQINFMHGPVQRRFDRRKIILAVLQQSNLIVWNNLGHSRVAFMISSHFSCAQIPH